MSHALPIHLKNLHIAGRDQVRDLESLHLYSYYSRSAGTLYPRTARTVAEEPKIPDPNLFVSLTDPTPMPPPESDLPRVSECAVHLELLEVFFKLRKDILESRELDAVFGITPNKKTVYRRTYDHTKRKYVYSPAHLRDPSWPTRRLQKWSYFLGIAVGRFKVWMSRMNEFLGTRLNNDESSADFWAGTGWMRLQFLPPLDILMVWHAFLLNPYDYEKFKQRYALAYVYFLPFPWKAVHGAINPRDWTYTLPTEPESWSKSHPGIEPDLLRYLREAGSRAPCCVSAVLSRYTQSDPPLLSQRLPLDVTPRDAAFLSALPLAGHNNHIDKALVENVQRQAAFVDKMHLQLWVRSPALEGTLQRAVDRYDKFLQLFRLYRGKTLVPTLDIDLVWHTHQCSARAYAESGKRRTGVFLNHNDKLGTPVLQGGMEEMKVLYRVRFGVEYGRCLCWDCEVMKSAAEEADEDESLGEGDMGALLEKARKDVEYYRCVEIARRRGRPLPIRAL